MKTEASQSGNLKGISWMFLLIGCIAAITTYVQSTDHVEKELRAKIDLRAAEAKYLFEGEISQYVEVLRGLQAQFAVDPYLSRGAFHRFSNALTLEARLPGVQAVVFAQYVRPGEAEAFEEVARQELARDAMGYPPPVIHPRVQDTDAHIVQYLAPIERNIDAAWFNLGSKPKRRAAIERARDTGEWSNSGRLRLMISSLPVDGVIFFLPVYSGGSVPQSLAQRREQFVGVVMLVTRVDEMMRQVFGHALLSDLDIEIYERSDKDEVPRSRDSDNVIFDSGSLVEDTPLHAGNPDFPLRRGFDISIGGTMWRFEVTALPQFTSSAQQWLPPIATVSVLLLTALMFYALRVLEASRHRMLLHANEVEEELHSKETQLERIADSINAVLWRVEMPGAKLTYISTAFARLSGLPLEDFLRDGHLWMKTVHPDDLERLCNTLQNMVETGNETFQFRTLGPKGKVRWIRCEAHFTPGAEPGTGYIDGFNSDITDQRLLEESLRRSNRALRAIHECEEAIATLEDENALLQTICDVVVKAGYQMAWAGVLPDESGQRILPVGLAGKDHGYLDCIGALLESGQVDQFPTIREAILERRPAVSNSFEVESASVYLRVEALRRGLKSKVTLPLVYEDATIGILNVYAGEPDAFDTEGVVLLTDMVRSLAVAIRGLRERSGRRAAEAMARLRERAMEASANAIIITSAKPGYAIEYVNSAYERMTGYAADEVIGRNPGFLHRDDREQPGLAEIRAILREKREGHAVLRNYRKDGTPFWSDVYIAPVRNEEGDVTHFVAAKYDITATKQYEAELQFQASYDALTGVANRHLLHDRLSQSIAFASRKGHAIWVVFINLDRFKVVNETLGFAAGDQLLKQIAGRLRTALRETDTVARLSGDEFVLVLPECSNDTLDTAGIQRLMQAIAQPLTIDGHEFMPTCSVGVSVYPADGTAAEALIKQAHIAMYRAKERGRNNFQFYMPAMNDRILERQRLESDLRSALDRGEFELHYQPQVELRTGKIVGMEALLRWQHPTLGTVSPLRFIDLAEETGLIVPIGAWVLRTACLQARMWQQSGYGQLRVAVNLSARQFSQANLAESIADILQQTGLPATCLDIELTESLVMADVEQAIGILADLKKLGVHLSIDDFGTGYSSLAYLKRFPIDMLKVDQSFVRDLATDPDDAAIVRSVISLAHSLRVQVIAEGVETEAQLSYLRRHGCDQMQGYLFSRPLATQAFEQLLVRGHALTLTADSTTDHEQTLLLIDDEVNVTAALQRLLRRDGYRILRATSAAEGFELLARHRVHVILCDQRMPVMNGTEFLRKVKDLYPDTIRIVLSGYTDLQSVIDAINRGAIYRFFTKPWEDEVLRENIREAFRQYWLLHRGVPEDIPSPAAGDGAAARLLESTPISTMASGCMVETADEGRTSS